MTDQNKTSRRGFFGMIAGLGAMFGLGTNKVRAAEPTRWELGPGETIINGIRFDYEQELERIRFETAAQNFGDEPNAKYADNTPLKIKRASNGSYTRYLVTVPGDPRPFKFIIPDAPASPIPGVTYSKPTVFTEDGEKHLYPCFVQVTPVRGQMPIEALDKLQKAFYSEVLKNPDLKWGHIVDDGLFRHGLQQTVVQFVKGGKCMGSYAFSIDGATPEYMDIDIKNPAGFITLENNVDLAMGWGG